MLNVESITIATIMKIAANFFFATDSMLSIIQNFLNAILLTLATLPSHITEDILLLFNIVISLYSVTYITICVLMQKRNVREVRDAALGHDIR